MEDSFFPQETADLVTFTEEILNPIQDGGEWQKGSPLSVFRL